MAPSRTRKIDSDGPSTADVSASEDVEMQDQNGAGNGFPVSSARACFDFGLHRALRASGRGVGNIRV
jgi:hypothetical protein